MNIARVECIRADATDDLNRRDELPEAAYHKTVRLAQSGTVGTCRNAGDTGTLNGPESVRHTQPLSWSACGSASLVRAPPSLVAALGESRRPVCNSTTGSAHGAPLKVGSEGTCMAPLVTQPDARHTTGSRRPLQALVAQPGGPV